MSSSMSFQRMSRPRSFLYAVLASIALSIGAAAPASAQQLGVIPSISGSGTLAGSIPTCTTPVVPNGTITACGAATVPFPNSLILIATPQPTPAGHWTFVRWEGCPVPAPNVCQLPPGLIGAFPVRAVFEDKTGPTPTQPTVVYSSVADRTVTLLWGANEPVNLFQCSVDGGAAATCGNGAQALTLPEGTHTFRVLGRDISNNLGALGPATTFRIVDTALVSGPTDISNVKSPTFVFSSLTGLNFECSIDSVVLADCGAKNPADNRGSKALSNLSEGSHTFRVRAKDGPEFDRVPVVRTWKVDTIAPVAKLDNNAGPGEGALQAVNKETFNFDANEAAAFECRLDSADFAPCSSGFVVERLTAGAHRFDVRAIDLAGNVGAVASRTWSVAASDSDNDGFNALIDCNDGDPAIRPGAIEVVDNGVDENCDGINGVTPPIVQPNRPAATEQVLVTLAFFSSATKKTTKFTTLQVKNVPLGATVAVTCKGKGCPSGLKGKGFTKRNAFGTVTLAKFIKKPLKAGDVVTVVVSKPNAISAIKILTVRASKKPLITTKCQPPGVKSPVAC